MKAALQRIGNSQGVIIPKPLLRQLDLSDEVELAVEDDAITIRKSQKKARAGWYEAAKQLVAEGDASLAWPEFRNDADAELVW
jgi:antitoxin MazE